MTGSGYVTAVFAAPEPSTPPAPSIPDLPAASTPAAGTSSSSGYSGSNPSDNYYSTAANNEPTRPFSSNQIAYVPRPMLIYFPPYPPRLNAHVELPSPTHASRPAPAELASFIADPFYPQLSTRLIEKTLRANQRTRLDAYLTEKLRLQNELHTKIDSLRRADPLTRQHEFEAFAPQQETAIAALEKEAEELRTILTTGEFFQNGVDWNDTRDWRLGDRFYSATGAMAAQFQVMRASAYYQKGLSPAQRRLLREVSMELGELSLTTIQELEAEPDRPTTPTDNNPLLYFSPDTARVRLPADLPAELADKITAYEREKAQLKKELRDTIYQQDSASLAFLRTRSISTLARTQEPRMAALESLAEEIRRDLAQLPSAFRAPPAPKLPPTVFERLDTFVAERELTQRNLLRMIVDAGRIVAINQISYAKDPEGHYQLRLSIDPRERKKEKVAKVQASFEAYSRENDQRNQELVRSLAALREEAASLLGVKNTEDQQKEIDRFLAEAADLIESQHDWSKYGDYRTAVLEPGLSPAQRRLLFDAALTELDLPLPGLDRFDGRDRVRYDSGHDRFPSAMSGFSQRGSADGVP